MPPSGEVENEMLLEQVAEAEGVYPAPAYEFIQNGLSYTVHRIYGLMVRQNVCRHITGQQLCHGLRELAIDQWGYLAQTVLRTWNITETADFGRMVFILVRHGAMTTTPEDTLDDFRNVYDFTKTFESAYRIPVPCL